MADRKRIRPKPSLNDLEQEFGGLFAATDEGWQGFLADHPELESKQPLALPRPEGR